MTIDALRAEVCEANRQLVQYELVMEAFGNASGIDRERGLVVIKPSGIACSQVTPDSLVVTDLEGTVVEGALRPSSDLPTHLALYRAFKDVGGIAHTHSRFATVWAQAGREIPCFGTTHADYFPGPIPITEQMGPKDIREHYEWSTGQVIVKRFANLDPDAFTAVLVHSHAPFCWAPSAAASAHLAAIVEEIAQMAYHTLALNPHAISLSSALRDKHYYRKHGPTAYYGQSR